MFRVFQHHVAVSTFLELLADTLLCFFAVLLAASTLHMVPDHGSALPTSSMLLPAVGFALVMMILYSFVGVYRRGATQVTLGGTVRRMLIALLVGAYITYVGLGTISDDNYASHVVGYAVLYLLVGLVIVRGAVFMLRRSVGVPRVLIVGGGADARRVAGDLASGAGRVERNVVGFYPTADGPDPALHGYRIFSREASILDVAREHGIDEIIVAAREQRGGGVPMDQLLACRIRGIPILDMAGFYERSNAEVPIDSLKASWLVYGHGFVQGPMRRMAKRAFDIASSATLLVLASPIMLLTAIAIRLDSPGPIIYRQERVGLGGRSFMCLKFRSMRTDAEKDGVARWATKNDSRVTRVGSFIRKTRIDELPQLLSVLRGEMSMVGPRPERPSFVAQLREQIPFYDLRHSVKPGVTGWAQVRYSYGASVDDARRKHQYDLYYVKNNTLFLDLLVLVETVSVVLFREGAQ